MDGISVPGGRHRHLRDDLGFAGAPGGGKPAREPLGSAPVRLGRVESTDADIPRAVQDSEGVRLRHRLRSGPTAVPQPELDRAQDDPVDRRRRRVLRHSVQSIGESSQSGMSAPDSLDGRTLCGGGLHLCDGVA
jgi:hypothetical protein